GLTVGIVFLLRTNLRNPYFYTVDRSEGKHTIRIKLAQEVSFLNKGAIQYMLTHIPKDNKVIIDGTQSLFIDKDVLDTINDFYNHAHTKDIQVELINIHPKYELPKLKELDLKTNETV
ncbi:MAG: SulP family inorganic anion transporter, partial [Bacteroidetes bacterium]|nr:SulP family inorganic anion transporter [Bacteroidota bacterium]MBU1760464.1 SulP family inorganic anion transporter [Bacteroidota bacterium]